MKVYDMHIHAWNTAPDPELLLARMEETGVYGGCVFSNWPEEANAAAGTPFEVRLNEVLSWTKGHEDRLFPVLWIHPYEENIIEKLHIAVSRGICAFKIICTDFHVSEERCLAVLREIASLDKPVFFHSGILWDGTVSSGFNRPLNWEALLDVKGLRFSMGHCSWPWIDECIALYGKFLNAQTTKETAEMFLDVTPGTPEIYREELWKKLYTVGYDTGDNLLFGTDSSANDYNPQWAGKWLGIDGKILDALGVSRLNREKLYHDNLMRFLGRSACRKDHIRPVCDDAGAWSPVNPEVPGIIDRWYKRLRFPADYDREFQEALKNIPVSDTVSIDTWQEQDGKRNLLSFLFMCSALEEKYLSRGVGEDILLDTLSDVVIWTNTYSELKGELWLGETGWLKRHMSMTLFRLGRLQFGFGEAEADVPEIGLSKGDPIMEIHIPEGPALTPEACQDSIARARAFFAEYYPEYEYKCFTCHSWLLDDSLKELLSPDSNILRFQELFHIVQRDPSDAILRYVFRWDAKRRTLNHCVSSSSFAEKVKTRALSGGSFFECLGVLKQ